MNIGLCIAWFMFGFIVGWILLIGIALGIKEKEDKKSGKERISEQSSNDFNQDKQ